MAFCKVHRKSNTFFIGVFLLLALVFLYPSQHVFKRFCAWMQLFRPYACCLSLTIWLLTSACSVKKENEIFLKYKDIQMGPVQKSYMKKSFLIYEEMRKYLTIYEVAVSHIWLCNRSIPSEFPYVWGKILFSFLISVNIERVSFLFFLWLPSLSVWPSLPKRNEEKHKTGRLYRNISSVLPFERLAGCPIYVSHVKCSAAY
jgi:hypothetical protein